MIKRFFRNVFGVNVSITGASGTAFGQVSDIEGKHIALETFASTAKRRTDAIKAELAALAAELG